MEFFKNNKFLITCILFLSACGYFFLYIQEEKKENILIEENISDIKNDDEVVETKSMISVDIAGEILNPGLYVLDEGSRVNDLIILAGGVTEQADLSEVNLAYRLADGIKITIPNKNDKNSIDVLQTGLKNNQKKNVIININQADIEQLMQLPGVGESTAENIIDYRNVNGNFKKKEDIKNVSGIGDSKYSKIKDKISV